MDELSAYLGTIVFVINQLENVFMKHYAPNQMFALKKRFKSERSATQTIKTVNQFINTLVCDCSSCASQLPKRVTYRHKQSTFQYMLINF